MPRSGRFGPFVAIIRERTRMCGFMSRHGGASADVGAWRVARPSWCESASARGRGGAGFALERGPHVGCTEVKQSLTGKRASLAQARVRSSSRSTLATRPARPRRRGVWRDSSEPPPKSCLRCAYPFNRRPRLEGQNSPDCSDGDPAESSPVGLDRATRGCQRLHRPHAARVPKLGAQPEGVPDWAGTRAPAARARSGTPGWTEPLPPRRSPMGKARRSPGTSGARSTSGTGDASPPRAW